jgi:hypothetical protein
VHVGRALLLHELGRREEALAAFERAVRASGNAQSYVQRLADYRALLLGGGTSRPDAAGAE